MENQKKDYSLKWFILYSVMLGGFMVSVDGSIVNLILPTLVEDLNTEFAIVQWVVVSYLLTLTTLILILGRLGDVVGKKKVYFTGFILFTTGSVLCGLAPSIYWLICLRVLQGLGGAMILALGFAIATEAFPPPERGKTMGILASVVSSGVIAGPVVGGFLVDFLSWHWIFFVNLPFGLLGIFMVARYVPDSRTPMKTKFDFIGAIMLLVCMLSLLMALTLGQRSGFGETPVLLLFILSLICAVLFVGTQLKIRSPMIDFKIFQNVFFSVNLTTTFFFYFAITGVFVLAPFYLQNILGYPANKMGMLFAAMSVMMVVLSPVAGILSDRFGTGIVIIAGLSVMLFIYCCLTNRIDINTTTLECMVGMLFLGTGMGLFMPPNHSAIMGAIPREHLGIASGLIIVARTLGLTAGVAVLGAVWAGRVRFYTGGDLTGGVAAAPVNARVEGLQDIFILAGAITAMTLILIIWGLVLERRDRIVAQSAGGLVEKLK